MFSVVITITLLICLLGLGIGSHLNNLAKTYNDNLHDDLALVEYMENN